MITLHFQTALLLTYFSQKPRHLHCYCYFVYCRILSMKMTLSHCFMIYAMWTSQSYAYVIFKISVGTILTKHLQSLARSICNYLWHIDGFDKLNRWGFYVHGAIDGYSGKILWLQVFVTNKDPWLVGKFFMEYVKESSGRHALFSICPICYYFILSNFHINSRSN